MIKCNVCGYEFKPIFEEHYISRDNNETGLAAAIKGNEVSLYDTFDCPECGCQIIAQKRKRGYIEHTSSEDESKEEEYEDET